jgi:type IV pilus assembly protein PilN
MAISSQDGSNNFLKREIAVLDKQLDQIKRLKEQTQALAVAQAGDRKPAA